MWPWAVCGTRIFVGATEEVVLCCKGSVTAEACQEVSVFVSVANTTIRTHSHIHTCTHTHSQLELGSDESGGGGGSVLDALARPDRDPGYVESEKFTASLCANLQFGLISLFVSVTKTLAGAKY